MQELFIVNGREISVVNDGCIYRFPTLTKTSKTGKQLRWEIYVQNENEVVTVSYYYPDGKRKISDPTIIYGKNIGRSNETTDFEQAIFHAHAKWLNQLERQGYRPVGIGKPSPRHYRPMLAHKYIERGQKYLTEPFGVSPKLDGIRGVALYDNGEVVILSRNGKPFVFLNKVKNHIRRLLKVYGKNIILDGELYSHDLTFSQISGIVRASKNKSPYDDQIQYYIFDNITDNIYSDRMKLQDQLMHLYHDLYPNENERALKFVGYTLATHNMVNELHNTAVNQGYEGIMMRDLEGLYELGQRSNALLKYKEFTDEEFKVVGYTAGQGNEYGAIIFICTTPDGKEFSVRLRGSISRRREMYKKGETYIGKYLTVRYQEKDPVTGIPRFPVGIEIRDYE